MATRRVPFQIDEWFHCYNRGIDKRIVFEDEDDAERFLQFLYLANSKKPFHWNSLKARKTDEIVTLPRAEALVSIGAYCLMPNHFHLLLKEVVEDGIVRFMQKLGTAYTMYFNIKNSRTGNLFTKPFRSRHVGDDTYFQHVINYVHCNPAEIFESNWKRGHVKNMDLLEKKLREYRFSSFSDYCGEKRAVSSILSDDGRKVYAYQSARKILEDAREYYLSVASADPHFSS